MSAFLTNALDGNGVSVHVDDVPKGAKCGCFCPRCKEPLIAKNAGDFREHHFAHHKGHECEGAYESSLHLMAKEVLQEGGKIMLPQSSDSTYPSGLVAIHNIELEKWDETYGIRPDVEGIMENGERLLIEFFVSHKVDSRKRKIIVDNHLKCIEININFQVNKKEQLKKFLTQSSEDRQWITTLPTPKNSGDSFSYPRNPLYDEMRDALKDAFDKGTFIIHPHFWSGSYDIRHFGYDSCEQVKTYRGLRTDLLIYRSKKENTADIALSIRGRCRNYSFRCPEGLRIIDIILSRNITKEQIEKFVAGCDLSDSESITVEYMGFLGN